MGLSCFTQRTVRSGHAFVLGLALAVAGCGGTDPNDGSGGGPGGPGGGTGGNQDASPDGDTGVTPPAVLGTLCAVFDLRSPTACSARPPGVNLTERGTDNTAISDGSGAFTLPVEGTSPVTIDVSVGDPNYTPTPVRTSLDENDLANIQVLLISQTTLGDLIATLDANQPDGSALIAVYMRNGNNIALGANILQQPAGTVGNTFYDQPGAIPFNAVLAGVGDSGVALIVGVPVGNGVVSFSVSDQGGGQLLDVNNVPVLADGLSTVLIDFGG